MIVIRKQRGMTLIIGLFLLVVLTLMALVGFNMGKGSVQTVANMQQRNEAAAAAQSVIEQAISTTLMFKTPNSVLKNACGSANTACVDTNGDGKTDITVRLTPAPKCVAAKPVLNASLDVSNPEDAGCSIGVQQNLGVSGAGGGNSMCANSIWEINAEATDDVTEAKVTVTEGAAVRVAADDIAASCP